VPCRNAEPNRGCGGVGRPTGGGRGGSLLVHESAGPSDRLLTLGNRSWPIEMPNSITSFLAVLNDAPVVVYGLRSETAKGALAFHLCCQIGLAECAGQRCLSRIYHIYVTDVRECGIATY
jgi:hypothetical protein